MGRSLRSAHCEGYLWISKAKYQVLQQEQPNWRSAGTREIAVTHSRTPRSTHADQQLQKNCLREVYKGILLNTVNSVSRMKKVSAMETDN